MPLKLLHDPERSDWRDREIARLCRVDHELVGRLRPKPVLTGGTASERTYTTKHGTTAKMKTGKIGRTPPPALTGGRSEPDGRVRWVYRPALSRPEEGTNGAGYHGA